MRYSKRGRGWHGNSLGHSLASRGIKSANKKPEMMSKANRKWDGSTDSGSKYFALRQDGYSHDEAVSYIETGKKPDRMNKFTIAHKSSKLTRFRKGNQDSIEIFAETIDGKKVWFVSVIDEKKIATGEFANRNEAIGYVLRNFKDIDPYYKKQKRKNSPNEWDYVWARI